ncbi:PREDICTED: ras-related protein Rab-17 isoform X2 [Dipodomys ordii]|uniref:Ras-related protein Rab-17 n=1 Tax=Dipodomys ordii TaxID=10020 RepID=A0A1S3EL52_DIPOR|nr:PREDICTED: ras-related protein Rab-17 isoform X2 [Dipodomys ordii]
MAFALKLSGRDEAWPGSGHLQLRRFLFSFSLLWAKCSRPTAAVQPTLCGGRRERDRAGHWGPVMAQVDSPRPGAAPGQPLVSKLVLLGSGSVGKSSLALRFVKQDFKNVLPTVGCAFFTKVVDVGASSLKLEIWDTAGQEKYHSVCHLYFRGANAALLVYDITQKDSFHRAQQWLSELEKEFSPGEVVVMLVGNKTDLGEEREVTAQEGKEFAESKRLLFMETSAKADYQPRSSCRDKKLGTAPTCRGVEQWI